MDALIRPDEVTKRYDGDAAPAVDGVSLQIAPGDTAAVMGPSGRGKPAPLNMIAGLDRAPRVCVLVPTRNEAGNVGPLLTRLGPVLAGLGGEVLFVDDSDDHTPAAVAAAASAAAIPVRLLHRARGERTDGLGGAVQEGLAAATGRWIVVMDGDLQHPPERVPDLIAAAERGADLVVATRYAGQGSAGGLSSRFRGLASRGAGAAARMLFPRALAGVSDPMSGFFAVRTAAVHPGDLHPRGFKILLELLVRTPGLRVAEVPFTFAERHAGQSKASGREAARYLRQLVALRLAAAGRAARLLRFALVGGSGVLVNLAALALLLRVAPGAIGTGTSGHIIATVAATQAAVGWNFALTERWVFPGRPGHWAARLLPFWVINCGALLAQLPLAARLQPVLGGSYVQATGAALVLLMVARFVVCDRWLYRPAGRSRAPAWRPLPSPGRGGGRVRKDRFRERFALLTAIFINRLAGRPRLS
jgi:dolichol-phosphate mannosyltransferase